jgi:predicted HTH transcriptional regulator
MIAIRMTKKTNGKSIVEEYKKTYGSLGNLEKIIIMNPDNPKAHYDLKDWIYYINHLDEEVKEGKTIFRDHTSISTLELELMNFIKYDNPKSIKELARLISKDVTTIQRKVNNLEKEGLISLIDGSKNSKIPVMNYDKIEIAI